MGKTMLSRKKKNNGNLKKNMVLLKNFNTCTIETNYGTILKTIENMEDYEKPCNFDFQMDKNL